MPKSSSVVPAQGGSYGRGCWAAEDEGQPMSALGRLATGGDGRRRPRFA